MPDYGERLAKSINEYQIANNVVQTALIDHQYFQSYEFEKPALAYSFKFAAMLQEFQEGNNPTLIRIKTGSHHTSRPDTGSSGDKNS